MTLIELPGRTIRMPVVSLYAVQSRDGRWLVYFDEPSDRVAMLLFTSAETARRYINACPDLLDDPDHSLALFCRDRCQLRRMARRARERGVHAFQVDRLPSGDCWYDLELDALLAEE